VELALLGEIDGRSNVRRHNRRIMRYLPRTTTPRQN
jgi:hypothetical protein